MKDTLLVSARTLVNLTKFRTISAPRFKLLWRTADHILEVRNGRVGRKFLRVPYGAVLFEFRWLPKMDAWTGIFPFRRLWNDRQTQSTIIMSPKAHSWPPWLPAKFPTSPLRATSSSLKACA